MHTWLTALAWMVLVAVTTPSSPRGTWSADTVARLAADASVALTSDAQAGDNQANPEIALTDFHYDAATDRYTVYLSLIRPDRVDRLALRVLDDATGDDIPFGEDVVVNRQPTLKLVRGAAALRAGQKYHLLIRAIGPDGNYLRRPSQGSSQDDSLTFASRAFTYQPPAVPPVTFRIDAVSGDFASGALVISLDRPTMDQALSYDGVIVDKNGTRVLAFPRSPLPNTSVQTALPEAMRRPGAAMEYHLTLRLYNPVGQRVAEQERDFTLVPPPPPGLLTRLTSALTLRPALLTSMAVILAAVTLIFVLRRSRRRRKPLPRPPQALPRAASLTPVPIAVPADGGATSAWLIVQQGSGPGQRYSLSEGETGIGRADDNAVVLKDARASRWHATVTRRGATFTWSDAPNVSNPTVVNGQPLQGRVELRAGDELEIGSARLVFRLGESPSSE